MNSVFCSSSFGLLCTKREITFIFLQALPKSKKRHGPRRDNRGIRAVESAKYLEDLSPRTHNFPERDDWKPTMKHGAIFYRFLCQDYEIAAGEILVPDKASVFWSDDENLLSPERAGDILPGVYSITPNARKAFSTFEVGGPVEFHLNQKKKAPAGRYAGLQNLGPVVKGTHWGSGVILRNEDRILIRGLLKDVFTHTCPELTPTVLALLLRSFWPSRTYVRLFKFGGKKGERLSEFHTERIAAVFSKN